TCLFLLSLHDALPICTYVAPIKSQTSFMAIRNIADEVRARGHDYRAKVHILKEQPATAQIAESLELEEGSPVLHSLITHYENDRSEEHTSELQSRFDL